MPSPCATVMGTGLAMESTTISVSESQGKCHRPLSPNGTGIVAHAEAPPRIVKGLAQHPVPVMLLARLAVDNTFKGKGLGAALLHDALSRTLQAADIAGIRAVIVHAKNDDARRFYEHFDFDPSPTDSYHLYLLLKDLQKAVR